MNLEKMLNDFLFQMWEFMENHAQSVFVQSYDEGIARVKRGGYAFLMESTILDYVVQVKKYCNLHKLSKIIIISSIFFAERL
jgi:ionotropic glutamate receptor